MKKLLGYNALLNTDETITKLSYACGFSSASSFNKLFKETYNCTPTEYRKQHINGISSINKDINKNMKKSKSYLDVDRKSAFKKLFSYFW